MRCETRSTCSVFPSPLLSQRLQGLTVYVLSTSCHDAIFVKCQTSVVSFDITHLCSSIMKCMLHVQRQTSPSCSEPCTVKAPFGVCVCSCLFSLQCCTCGRTAGATLYNSLSVSHAHELAVRSDSLFHRWRHDALFSIAAADLFQTRKRWSPQRWRTFLRETSSSQPVPRRRR